MADMTPSRMSDRKRLAQVIAILGRHGLGGIVSALVSGRSQTNTHPTRPEALVEALRELGPVATKLGQILAMRSDLLGPDWTAALSQLHDRVPGVPFECIEAPLAQALGEDAGEYFRELDREPIAAGSIAQVHAGIRSDGVAVIVKIRRPEIESIVDADMRLLRRIARLAQRASPLVERQRPDELLDCVAERIVIVARNHMRRTSDVAELRMGNQFPEFSGAFGRNKVARSTTH